MMQNCVTLKNNLEILTGIKTDIGWILFSLQKAQAKGVIILYV